MQYTHTTRKELIVRKENNDNYAKILMNRFKPKCTEFGSAVSATSSFFWFQKYCFHQCFCSSCLFVSTGVVCRVRGVEPANCHLAQCRGGGGCGGAEGTAAAAEWRLLQTGHPAGGPAERPAGSAGLPQHLARGSALKLSVKLVFSSTPRHTVYELGPTVFEQWRIHMRLFCSNKYSPPSLPPAVPAVGRSTGHALCWRGSSWRSVDTAKP